VNDAELCQKMIGLEHPWKVVKVEVSHPNQRLDIYIEHAPGTPFCCPECGKPLPVYDHAEERVWRHLDAFQFQTFLHARLPRVKCPEHGVRQSVPPWANPKGRFTLLMESQIIATLNQTRTVAGARAIHRLSWDEVWGVIERAVARGLTRRGEIAPEIIGVDEKAWRKGHSYVTILADLDKRRVIDLAKDRTKSSLASLYEKLTETAKKSIKAVSLDMWNPYRQATVEHIPDAEQKMVVDRFHGSQMLVKAVDKVRADEARKLEKAGDKNLRRTKFVFGKNEGNLTERQALKLAEVRKMDYETTRAWSMKEGFREFWNQPNRAAAFKYLYEWYKWVMDSAIPPMQEVATTFWSRSHHLLNWFDHRPSNGPLEGLNSLIADIKRRARGHRSLENLRTAILFYLGGLDMALAPHPLSTH
jgi:transposase